MHCIVSITEFSFNIQCVLTFQSKTFGLNKTFTIAHIISITISSLTEPTIFIFASNPSHHSARHTLVSILPSSNIGAWDDVTVIKFNINEMSTSNVAALWLAVGHVDTPRCPLPCGAVLSTTGLELRLQWLIQAVTSPCV